VVGVPDNTPLPASATPLGNDPDAKDHVYGVDPPVAARVAENPTPTVPDGNELVAIVGG
jgi:hypothetical protein